MEGACITFRSWPTGWDSHYSANNYYKYDEIARYCFQGNVEPIYWDDPALAPFRTNKSITISREARAFGITGGLSCPLPIAGDLGVGIFNIVTVGSERENLTRRWTNKDVQLLGGLLHLKMAELIEPIATVQSTNPPCWLTVREIECLTLVSIGKSTKEIADAINCSDRTVNFHIQNAMKKIGASSRLKAVCRALEYGWISP
jgi:DNA-binding CsgD family transcriptional regulator